MGNQIYNHYYDYEIVKNNLAVYYKRNLKSFKYLGNSIYFDPTDKYVFPELLEALEDFILDDEEYEEYTSPYIFIINGSANNITEENTMPDHEDTEIALQFYKDFIKENNGLEPLFTLEEDILRRMLYQPLTPEIIESAKYDYYGYKNYEELKNTGEFETKFGLNSPEPKKSEKKVIDLSLTPEMYLKFLDEAGKMATKEEAEKFNKVMFSKNTEVNLIEKTEVSLFDLETKLKKNFINMNFAYVNGFVEGAVYGAEMAHRPSVVKVKMLFGTIVPKKDSDKIIVVKESFFSKIVRKTSNFIKKACMIFTLGYCILHRKKIKNTIYSVFVKVKTTIKNLFTSNNNVPYSPLCSSIYYTNERI